MSAQVCPVVGTTNNVLPPSHPNIDDAEPGKKCPVTNASMEHHPEVIKHPSVPIPSSTDPTDASACPVLKTMTKEESTAPKVDDKVCPVVGTATTVLPPDHPSTSNSKEGDVCPVTKATVGHHVGKVSVHPSVESAPAGAVCPVVGARA